jgi:predicted metal-dependent hydrolase
MDIPRRDVDFAFADVPRDWAEDDAYATTFLNALSLLFPEGEQFFVRSVKHFADRITDPELAREVTGFIGQEAMHGREHRAFNEMLIGHGYREVHRVDKNLKGFLAFIRRILTPHGRLAATCALEHFTAMLAESLLREPRMRDPMDPSVRSLWLWHALEESEHKAVAFDVYKAVGGTERMRVWTMNFIRWGFVLGMALQVGVSLVGDKRTYERGELRRSWKRFKQSKALSKDMWLALKDYNRPDFHPDDRDTSALVAQWREELFGAEGRLNALLVKPSAA